MQMRINPTNYICAYNHMNRMKLIFKTSRLLDELEQYPNKKNQHSMYQYSIIQNCMKWQWSPRSFTEFTASDRISNLLENKPIIQHIKVLNS